MTRQEMWSAQRRLLLSAPDQWTVEEGREARGCSGYCTVSYESGVRVVDSPRPCPYHVPENRTRATFPTWRHDMNVGDWVIVKDAHDIPAIFRAGKPTRGRVEEFIEDGTMAIIHVPIGDADVDEHSQAVPYPLDALEPALDV
jgi:hypothetical protein